ncbi:hypothetical protein SAMN02745121_01280 [Nannocystis exedens]|uniref:Uncharacterized protein n=1 Tax=Nannocystis exedens TaxID=54 RepID=A0A1I1USZ2_9BACT|nr:hypothetical protein NAEX_05150 [Nannocystis exedens]SFD73824.1 hypothetical protein SAMN02745121_01280 [Nannocystis exedens]
MAGRGGSSSTEREAAKRRAARNAAIGPAVGLPRIVAGVTMFVRGIRAPRESRGIAATGDGRLVRFQAGGGWWGAARARRGWRGAGTLAG